jgi:putative ABC transport system permease protein
MSSTLPQEAARIIANAPGLRQGPDGPLASAELFVIVDLPKRSTGTEANVPLRGVQPAAFAVREDLRIVEGRPFEPGRNEIIAGRAAAEEFEGIEVGRTLRWGKNEWTVVGVFAAARSLTESELWCDVHVLQPAYRREETFQSVYAKLESPGTFDEFKDALTADRRLQVKVMREDEYYAAQSTILYNLITGLGTLVTVIMGVGAVFGAVNTMYSAVAARSREIATLRALGFGGGPVAVAVLVESLLLALAGGLVGGLGARLAFDGFRAATLNWSSFSQVVFSFEVTPALVAQGLGAALAMGLVGGVFPAIRAARLPVVTALREP